MKPKLNCVLLIDDDDPTNYFNSLVMQQVGCADAIHVVQSGQEALDYLTNAGNYTTSGQQYPQPDLIFLDINMPGMDGWEFLEKYRELHYDQKGKIVMVMLTTSLNPDDALRAKTFPEIAGFENKPLNTGIVEKILRSSFPENFTNFHI